MIYILRKAIHLAQQSEDKKEDYSRRDFIKTASAVGAGMLGLNLVGACGKKPSSDHSGKPRIAIIGAGISGLTTAYCLQKNGIDCKVFEASPRIGGRMFSIKGWAGEGTATDLGAEFVCDYHHDLIALAKELDVELYDLRNDDLFHQPPSFFVEGKERSFHEFVQGLQPAALAIKEDLRRMKFDFTYKDIPEFVKQLDQQSISQYLAKFNLATWVKRLLEVIFEAEYGMDASEQSVLNMLLVLRVPEQDEKTFEMLGKDYEVMKIKNGTQALAEAIYKRVEQQVVLNHTLTEYTVNAQGEYDLTFNQGMQASDRQTFDYVVFTLPFVLLRNIKTNVAYPAHKRDAIDHIGYGNNCKTIFGFNEPAWRKKNKSGAFFTDLLSQCGWDSTEEQRTKENATSSITFFYGGKNAETYNELSEEEILKASALIINKNLDIDFDRYYNQQTTGMLWKDYPYSKCSYTAFRVGEWTKYTGVPEEPFENIYFAGEHCNIEFQGFMNGSIQSAKSVVAQLTHTLNT